MEGVAARKPEIVESDSDTIVDDDSASVGTTEWLEEVELKEDEDGNEGLDDGGEKEQGVKGKEEEGLEEWKGSTEAIEMGQEDNVVHTKVE